MNVICIEGSLRATNDTSITLHPIRQRHNNLLWSGAKFKSYMALDFCWQFYLFIINMLKVVKHVVVHTRHDWWNIISYIQDMIGTS